MSSAASEPQPYSSLYKHFELFPENALFRKFGAFWAKKVHDETSELGACLVRLNDLIGQVPELNAKTVLDCPLRVVKEVCPKADHESLYAAWDEYDKAMMRSGMFFPQWDNLPR
jgi:hypothetical protein